MEEEERVVIFWLISFLIVLFVGFKLNQYYPKYADMIFITFMPIALVIRGILEVIYEIFFGRSRKTKKKF